MRWKTVAGRLLGRSASCAPAVGAIDIARGSGGKEAYMSHHIKTEKKAAPKKSGKKSAKKK